MGVKQLTIKGIPHKVAQDIIVKRHYLHRKAPCSYSWGLYDNDEIVGVIMYGTPSSAPLRRGIAGDDEKNNVIELTRLWIDDRIGKNAESYLIGNTVKKVNKEIVVSYAEIEQGHLGTVYQACSFLYTGLSAKRTNWVVEGIDKHCQTIADKHTSAELKAKYGSKFKLVPRPRKHRYVFINAKKKRRLDLINKLKYKIQDYPTNENIDSV